MTNDDLQQASAWTRNYRNQNPNGIKAHCLSADTLQGILAQEGCVGIRAYYGIDEAGNPQLVLVGYDANDQDILPAPPAPESRSVAGNMPTAELKTDDMPGLEPTVSLATNFPPCPPCCSIENPLNS